VLLFVSSIGNLRVEYKKGVGVEIMVGVYIIEEKNV